MDEKEYLGILTEQIRCRRARPSVEKEVRTHIEDQAEAFRLAGMNGKDALDTAVAEMGDPVEAGAMLDRVHRPKMEWSVLAMVLLLGAAGIVMQFIRGGIQSGLIFTTIMGLCIMLAVYRMDYTFLGRYAFLIWALLIAVIMWCWKLPLQQGRYLVYVLSMLTVPVYGAVLFRLRGKRYSVLPVIMCMLFLQLRIVGGSGAAVIQIFLYGFLLFAAAVCRDWYRVHKGPALAALGAVMASILSLPVLYAVYFHDKLRILPEYQAVRIRAVFFPQQYAKEASYQIVQVRNAVQTASLWGNGRSSVEQYLPNVSEEYMVTWIFSYFGIAAGLLFIALFAYFIWRSLRSVWRRNNQLGSMIGLACVCVLAGQGVIYICSNLWGSIVAQFNMPFISGGRECILMNYILAGLLLSVYGNSSIADEGRVYMKKRRWKLSGENK